VKGKLWNVIKKTCSQKVTFLCVSHTPKGPIKFSFSLLFILFVLFLWTTITGVSVYLSSKHIDYWSAKIKSLILRSKYEYVNQQLSKSWELLAEVQQNDEQLRKLLNMKTKRDIIISSAENSNQGGPSFQESTFLQKITSKPEEVSVIEYNAHLNALKQQLENQINSYKEIIDTINYQKELYRNTPMIWPCYGRLTSPFGQRIHPVYKTLDFHSGFDIANEIGTDVTVTADGIVKFVGWQAGYGRAVVVEHKFGYKTVYGHLSVFKVKVGQKVRRGEVIGLMGDSGTSTGPHLHYEVWKDGVVQNPIRYVDPEKFFK